MMEYIREFFSSFVAMFVEVSPYLLLGFAVAAVIEVFIPTATMLRWLGSGKLSAVWRAAVIGVPLPLCSCSVLPTALGLRRRGAGQGAVLSFLITTPQTGADSIALTWGLMGPIMAVIRPLASLASGVVAGICAELLPDQSNSEDSPTPEQSPSDPASPTHEPPLWMRLQNGFDYLFDDIGHLILLGLVLSALVSVVIPQSVFESVIAEGFTQKLLMVVVGIPLYVCAAASTPVATVLLLKGVSPGAVLVFLLCGPATNIGSLALLVPVLGKKLVAVYLAVVIVVSLVFGMALDLLLAWGMPLLLPTSPIADHTHACLSWWDWAMAALMAALFVRLAWRTGWVGWMLAPLSRLWKTTRLHS